LLGKAPQRERSIGASRPQRGTRRDGSPSRSAAADLLALFLKDKETRIRAALRDGDLAAARKLVNGGHDGLTEFSETYRIGDAVLG
jgi:hypothetical protein